MSHRIEKIKSKILKALNEHKAMRSIVLYNRVMNTKYSVLEYSNALDALLAEELIFFDDTFIVLGDKYANSNNSFTE